MSGKPKPPNCYLNRQEYFGVREDRQVWRSKDNERYYTWDSLHGEIEVFNKRGRHLGSLDAISGKTIKDAVKGRKINL